MNTRVNQMLSVLITLWYAIRNILVRYRVASWYGLGPDVIYVASFRWHALPCPWTLAFWTPQIAVAVYRPLVQFQEPFGFVDIRCFQERHAQS